jgi:hypothetical protein
MAHSVTFDVPPRPLGRADVSFVVKKNRTVLGTLTVSNGSLVWFPRSTIKGHKIGWARFDRLMKAETVKVERR